ncbi:hypothetical protein JMJ35_010389 [Cladonia borealis]|uniref:tRNA (uracil-O(2)-)-methyltransferase n=1 Tax=Cladonia borealis TaxID=184061 RepID=A0AA39QT09_9LECA|nr:hypothetical protein JMJ35_010389 [Cladonia borealis]
MPVHVSDNNVQQDVAPSQQLPGATWLPVLQQSCNFPPDIFESVSLNLLKNPNINSSLLFRADVIYDSLGVEQVDVQWAEEEIQKALQTYNVRDGDFPGFDTRRTIVRQMIPRNPQLDKPIAQTCVFLQSMIQKDGIEQTIVLYIPHAPDVDAIPWYHPRVQALAYLHSWNSSCSPTDNGTISLHYRLFPSEPLPLPPRLLRTGQNLLSTLRKHGQGQLAGYTKRVHHDQLVSQQRVQDTYTELKAKHAKRLCDGWVEKTEPSKHVFEDLSIAAFLIELWKDMYKGNGFPGDEIKENQHDQRPSFPGFVDVGCGNGVLVDILLREGYPGWGFDARQRKTWSTFSASIRQHLKELILIPQPLFELKPSSDHLIHANGGILSKSFTIPSSFSPVWHNGIFPTHTFIISNHADELTPWTPLLASLSLSPFLAIPCCSHNLSGRRFRAPSVFNSNSADALAPSYFAANVKKSKSIAIAVACPDAMSPENEISNPHDAERGDLNDLSLKARKKQKSAYSSLCDWVAHLAGRVGYEVEREWLRLPSTRNVGIIGRRLGEGFEGEGLEERRKRVVDIVAGEGADGMVWVKRATGLMSGKGGEGH